MYTGKIDTIATVSKLDTCFSTLDFGFPCSQPPLLQFNGDAVKVSWTPLNASKAITTYKNAVPTQFFIRLCYSVASTVDRSWRSKHASFPGVSLFCF